MIYYQWKWHNLICCKRQVCTMFQQNLYYIHVIIFIAPALRDAWYGMKGSLSTLIERKKKVKKRWLSGFDKSILVEINSYKFCIKHNSHWFE